MALKKQVTTIEEVPEALRDHYKPVEGGVGFVLEVDGEEDTTTLKRTLERVKQERNDAIAEAKRKGEDVANIEASWKVKVEEAEKAHSEHLKNTTAALKRVTIERTASEIALRITGGDVDSAELVMPLVEKRLKAEVDGTRAITRVLDAEGKASALSLADLENELRSDKRFSRVAVKSNASGSGATPNQNNPAGGGATVEGFNPLKNTDSAAHYQWIAERKAKRGA